MSTSKRLSNSLTVIRSNSSKKLFTKTFSRKGKCVESYGKISRLGSVESVQLKTHAAMLSLLRELEHEPTACVIRGELRDDAPDGPTLRRNTHFSDPARKWIMIDIDDLELPASLQGASGKLIARYVRSRLPAEFHGVKCVWQMSCSAGFAGANCVKMHLWFKLLTACTSASLRRWLADVPHIDPSVFKAVQPHYVAAPICDSDPISKRSGMLKGPVRSVAVPANIDAAEVQAFETLCDPRDEAATTDVSAQVLKSAKRRAFKRAQEILDTAAVAYRDAYAAGCVLGRYVALKSWNGCDHEAGAGEHAAKLAGMWGEAFGELPRVSQTPAVYSARVAQGISWSFAQAWADLAGAQSKSADRRHSLEQLREQATRALRQQINDLHKERTTVESVAATLGRYTGAEADLLSRKKVISAITQTSGHSVAEVEALLLEAEANPVDVDAWRNGLKCTGKFGEEIKATEANVCQILLNHPDLQGVFRYNDRSMYFEVVGKLPWSDRAPAKPTRMSLDRESGSWIEWFARLGVSSITSALLYNCFCALRAQTVNVDPFVEYLGPAISKKKAQRELEALGPSRLDKWLRRHFKASNNRQYLAAVGRKFLISAVARAYDPGCQVDSILVLAGPEGLRKTSVFRTLGQVIGNEGFRNLGGIHSKDDLMMLQGPVICESGELAAFQGRSEEMAKNFLTKTSDSFRGPYERVVEDHKRRCVIGASTNEDEFLSGPGDHRRYWVVNCTVEAADFDTDVAGELWAEARLRYFAGEQWWLTDEEKALHNVEIGGARFNDSWEGQITAVLKDTDVPVKIVDVLKKISPDTQLSVADQRRCGRALKVAGWRMQHTRDGNVWLRAA